MMWSFDVEKTKNRICKLNNYYEEQGLNACSFHCSEYRECELSHSSETLCQYKGGTAAVMPLYDINYNNHPIRILIIGKETGYMKNSKYGTSENFSKNTLNVLNCINWKNKNNHIKGTLKILQYLLEMETEYVYSSFALSNLLRCSFQSVDKFQNLSGTKDTKTMRHNCLFHLINEIKILEPTIIITQGEWAIRDTALIDALSQNFGTYEILKTNRSGKYGLYKFKNFHLITTHHPAILGNWIKNLAPDSVWPMIDFLRDNGAIPYVSKDALPEFEAMAKSVVDPLIADMPSNDILRQ